MNAQSSPSQNDHEIYLYIRPNTEGLVMIYVFIGLLLISLLLELIITRGRFSPSVVMISLWIGMLVICEMYSDVLWSLSMETLTWVTFGVYAFFIGGLAGKSLAYVKFENPIIKHISIVYFIPIYLLMFVLFYFMMRSGYKEDGNWYIGIRKIINYGQPDIYFTIFGYLYYIIFPVLFLAAVRYYSLPVVCDANIK